MVFIIAVALLHINSAAIPAGMMKSYLPTLAHKMRRCSGVRPHAVGFSDRWFWHDVFHP
jgi:hypothetical protein